MKGPRREGAGVWLDGGCGKQEIRNNSMDVNPGTERAQLMFSQLKRMTEIIGLGNYKEIHCKNISF